LHDQDAQDVSPASREDTTSRPEGRQSNGTTGDVHNVPGDGAVEQDDGTNRGGSRDEEARERIVTRAWGETVHRYRRWRGISRRELALRAGLSPVFLGEIERGEKEPSAHSLCLIAGALEVPLSELYLRVAVRLDGQPRDRSHEEQTSLPLGVREESAGYLDGVPRDRDETAFDLYRVARLLRSEHQISLLLLAQSLLTPSA
jgi:transcriptional regulator with XRE-family HTH domain